MRQIQSGSIARPKLNNLDSDLVICVQSFSKFKFSFKNSEFF